MICISFIPYNIYYMLLLIYYIIFEFNLLKLNYQITRIFAYKLYIMNKNC